MLRKVIRWNQIPSSSNTLTPQHEVNQIPSGFFFSRCSWSTMPRRLRPPAAAFVERRAVAPAMEGKGRESQKQEDDAGIPHGEILVHTRATQRGAEDDERSAGVARQRFLFPLPERMMREPNNHSVHYCYQVAAVTNSINVWVYILRTKPHLNYKWIPPLLPIMINDSIAIASGK